MIKLILSAIFILFLLPAPLILFSALFNWKVLKQKSVEKNLKEIGNAIVSAGTSLLFAVCTRPFTFLDTIPLLKKGTDNRPVLLVHGLYHNKIAWLIMKHRLNSMGFNNLNTWQYNSWTTSYPELVLELKKEIQKLYRENGSQTKVTLVGHSLGGLLISGAAAEPEISSIVSRIITLGTPFKGSILALFAPGRLGRSLHPQSELFNGENRIRFPEKITKIAVISPTDEMVLPWSNLEPDHEKWKIIRCSAMGHVAMLYSRRVTSIVAECIRNFSK